MNPSSTLVHYRRLIVAQVTIPAVASADTIAALAGPALAAAGESAGLVVGWRISDHKADRTTKRPAVCIGHSVVACISAYAQDSQVYPPVADTSVYVGGVDGAIVDAVIELYLK